MTTETEETNVPEDADATENVAPDGDGSADEDGADVEVGSPEFQELADRAGAGAGTDLDRFQSIKVTVSADLGRAEVPIQTLMNLGEGSVLELNRPIDSPVELVAQGVALACGEVVVVNGCFAIRVTKVYENQKVKE